MQKWFRHAVRAVLRHAEVVLAMGIGSLG